MSSLAKVRSQLILCSNCGGQVPEVLASCQFCGTPVPGRTNTMNISGANDYAPKQPELPAWLETLRSSERPPSPAGNESLYALPGSIDENALPSWMRSDKMDNSGKMPAIRPASRPAPNTEGGVMRSSGMSASSLIDEQSLPTWMQEPQAPSQSQVGQGSISAASLVQSEALPSWMKAVPPQAQQVQQVQQAQPTTPSISGQMPFAYTPPAVPQQRLSGNDLIDQQALPPWMSAQTSGTPAQGNAPGNMTAGSLVDANALPSWLREEVQQEQRGVSMPPPGAPGAPATPSVQPMQPTQSANMNNNISASSFIDVDALPGWLRSAEEQRGASDVRSGNNSNQNRSGAAPTRVENMRVPSRPRAEMPSLEESAVAANVFASMLGVASTNTNVPGQPQNGQLPPAAYPAQPPFSSASSPNNGMNGTSGASGSNWSGFPEGMAPAQLPPLVPPPGYGIPSSPGSSNNQNGQGFGVPGTPPQPIADGFQGNQTNQRNQGMPQQAAGNNFQSSQPTGNQQKQGGKKRGFLETILNWFPFSR
jgi:hypothetical protein